MKQIINKQYYNIRKKVLEVFKILRKKGYICKENYLCCQSCAGSGLANKITEILDKGNKPI